MELESAFDGDLTLPKMRIRLWKYSLGSLDLYTEKPGMLASRGTRAGLAATPSIHIFRHGIQHQLLVTRIKFKRHSFPRHASIGAQNGAAPTQQAASSTSIPQSPPGKVVPLPHSHAKGNVDAWVAVIEPFIPRPGSEPSPSALQDAAYMIPKILLEARNQANLDILFHIGVSCKRWATFMWIAQILIDKSRPFGFFGVDLSSVKTEQWLPEVTLDDATSEDARSTKKVIPLASTIFSRRDIHDEEDGIPLEKFTDNGFSLQEQGPVSHIRDILGQVWQTIGKMILAASSIRTKQEAEMVMQKALGILARLHHRGYIPDQVYANTPETDDPLSQPTMLHELSAQIFTNLSDAAYDNDLNPWQNFPNDVEDFEKQHENNASLWKNFQMVRFTSSLWLELVLWCCLHGGWLKEGASIIAEARKLTGDQKWSLICWKDIVTSPESKWNEILERRFAIFQDRNDGADDLQFSRPAQRTITAEVVVAFIDSLVSAISSVDSGYKIQEVLEKVNVLKGFLEKDKMGLGISTWDALIARLSEVPELSIDGNPRMMESILNLTEIYGRASSSANAPPSGSQKTSRTPYFLEGSSATLGFHHRVLMSYIQNGDSEGALRLLAHLQALTDTNKRKALEEFFKILKSNKVSVNRKKKQIDISPSSSDIAPVNFPAFYPSIPVDVLAALLDLLTESGSIEVEHWMFYSEDIDGPLISPELYSDQALAPSLIRFAAATDDESLLLKLSKAQSTSISGGTLIALCEARICQERWEDATNVLRLMSEYSLHEWSIQDFGMIIRALLRHLKDLEENDSSKHAAAFLQRLLRGDLGQVWGPDFTQLDTVVGVICSLNSDLAELCSNLLEHGHVSKATIPTQCFNLIMHAAVSTFGSAAGKRLWQVWCDSPGQMRQIEISSRDGESKPRQSISQQFSQEVEEPKRCNDHVKLAFFAGIIEPEIRTLRYVVEQALHEARSCSNAEYDPSNEHTESVEPSRAAPSSSPGVFGVLHWAAQVFRTRFNLRPVDIEHEFGGFELDPQARTLSSTALYSGSTLKIWDALSSTPSCKAWALTNEEHLRAFAANPSTQQRIFEPAPPAERRFLHCLAADLRMNSESFGEDSLRQVTVSKTTKMPEIPSLIVEEVARMKPYGIKRLQLQQIG